MANRVRTERLEIKLTKEEELFQAKMRQAKCKSINHFLRKCELEKEIYTVDLKPFTELKELLANATNNINKIAKRANSTGVIYKDNINDISEKIEQFSKNLWLIHSLLLNRTTKSEDD
ncbi:plasmid mobilization relaxosome protein MobC [Erysipelothrix rhusiopathiae]|nr:plasmid mobilization relaxosome protein MobC [Erysipelothrix rhusiopathiae]